MLNRIQIRDSRRHFSASRPFAEVAPSISIQMENQSNAQSYLRAQSQHSKVIIASTKGGSVIDRLKIGRKSTSTKIHFVENCFFLVLGNRTNQDSFRNFFAQNILSFSFGKSKKKIAIDESYEVSRTAKFLYQNLARDLICYF